MKDSDTTGEHLTEPLHFSLPEVVTTEFRKFVEKFDRATEPTTLMAAMGARLESLLYTHAPKVLDALKNQGQAGSPGMIVLDNVPIDAFIPPREGGIEQAPSDRVAQKGTVSENLLLAMSYIAGQGLDLERVEQNGRVINLISPEKSKLNTRTGEGNQELFPHNENIFSEIPPYHLGLLCLEGDTQAKTTYFFIKDLLKEVQKAFPADFDQMLEQMQKEEFRIWSGASVDGGKIEGVYPLLGVNTHGGEVRFRLYDVGHQRMQGETPAAQECLDRLQAILRQQKFRGIKLQPGQMIFFNNGYKRLEAPSLSSPLMDIPGIMHGRDGTVKNNGRLLERLYMYPLEEKDIPKISGDLHETMHTAITKTFTTDKTKKKFTFVELARMIGENILTSVRDSQNDLFDRSNPKLAARLGLFSLIWTARNRQNTEKMLSDEEKNDVPEVTAIGNRGETATAFDPLEHIALKCVSDKVSHGFTSTQGGSASKHPRQEDDGIQSTTPAASKVGTASSVVGKASVGHVIAKASVQRIL